MDSQQIIGYVYFSLIMVGAALMLFCVATIHRSPYFTEVQKLKWLLFVLILPYFGPLAWILRVRRERAEAAARSTDSGASAHPTETK
ncbi:MAG: PLDc N-terminal domain-containing protein [Rothia sp. (in: high G+C Gram-positive bacteria)]|uniref:PLDc N-terminal domain-containing protein n=1 Tax=Rothia sp. (in: high G+C Gram-positive bacteria) TaxID=1885016 RepID=UPI0026DFE904|nr:PLDc N-terminal domain-containing protein [Rothia sp. (in: high G+C Gram-positive bacteria)]MDO5750436.1 PLDc N-terminal domain-containing protein [Rothia sp. (in: high G+C Gram-positive bacteria)]